MNNEIKIYYDTAIGSLVEYSQHHSRKEVDAELPPGWLVDWDTARIQARCGRYRSPLIKLTLADERCADLRQALGNAEVISEQHRQYRGSTVIVDTVVGDPESDGEDYYSSGILVAWDEALDVAGEHAGACVVESSELATWLSRRFPCAIGQAGFASDGTWYEDGMDAARIAR